MATEKDSYFAQIAIREGYVSQDQIDEAQAMQRGQADPKPLAQILLERGYIDFLALTQILTLQKPKTEVIRRRRHHGPRPMVSLFGQIALQLGFCTQADIDECLGEQNKRETNGKQIPLGQLLIQKRRLTIAQFLEILKVQGRGILICNRCGTSHTVSNFKEDREFYCKRCSGLLRIPSRVDTVSADTHLGEDAAPLVEDEVSIPVTDEGRRVLGKYEVLDEIGRGGMGIVYKARHQFLDQAVALKVLRFARGKSQEEQIRRFEMEARLVSRFDHPSIVSIHDSGNEAGIHFYVMELVEGRSLAEVVRTESLREEEIFRLVVDLLHAIGFAHGKGIVHRDLKPSNVLVESEGQLKVTDFGLAIPIDPGKRDGIENGPVVGTPFYMAPEQVRGDKERIDARTDLYAIGVILYEMLTSRLPFGGTTVREVYQNILEAEVRAPRTIVASISPEAEALCLRAISRDPVERFQSAAEMVAAIARFLGEEEPLPPSPTSETTILPRRPDDVPAGPAPVEPAKPVDAPATAPAPEAKVEAVPAPEPVVPPAETAPPAPVPSAKIDPGTTVPLSFAVAGALVAFALGLAIGLLT